MSLQYDTIPTSRARSVYTRANSAYVFDEPTGKTLCRKCGAEANLRSAKRGGTSSGPLQFRCDTCHYKRRREMHPPEHPRVAKPKAARQPRPLPVETPSPYQDWPGEWKVCHASFLAAIYAKSGSNSSLTHYRAILHDFFVSVDGKIPSLVSRAEVESFLSSPGQQRGHEGEAVKFGCKNARLACLRSFMKYCAEWPTLDAQGIVQPLLGRLAPTAGIRFIAREKPPYRSLSESQIFAFFKSIPTVDAEGKPDVQGLKWRAFFLLAFHTAQRKSVLCTLRWGDIQRALIVEPGGKSRTAWTYAWHGGKGKSRESDSQELAPLCVEAIRAHLAAAGRLDTIAPADFIFTADPGHYRYDAQRPIGPQMAWFAAKRYARAANIPEELVCVHTFRHSSALHRFLAGESLFSISKTLRHRSIDMTAHYLEGLVSPVDDGIALLTSRFGNL